MSFWLTRESLLNLLARVGFTSVSEILVPAVPDRPSDRTEFLARKGTVVELRSSPLVRDVPFALWPHGGKRRRSVQLRWDYRLRLPSPSGSARRLRSNEPPAGSSASGPRPPTPTRTRP